MLATVQKSKFVCNGAKVEGHQQRCNIRRALATVQNSMHVGYSAIAESAESTPFVQVVAVKCKVLPTSGLCIIVRSKQTGRFLVIR